MGAAMKSSRVGAFVRSAIFAAFVPAMALPVGCAQFAACGFGWNVRGHPKDGLQDGYEDGAVYELQQDVFIMASDSGVERKEGYLVPPSSKKAPPRIFSSPATIESWEMGSTNLDKWNGEWARSIGIPDAERIVGIVRQGMRLKFLHMNRSINISVWFGYSRYDSPIAKILDGEYADWNVDIADVSNWFPEKHMDKRFLRKED